MPKPKLKDLKTYLSSLDEAGLRAELLKLFGKLPQVQEFYAQELMPDSDRKAMLEEYKRKIDNQFWTRTGNPRNSGNAKIKKLLTDFERASVFPSELVDLLLYRVETAADFASQFGGMPDAAYKASCSSFKKAVELMAEHKLEDYFRERCVALFGYDNLDYWYIEWLKECYAGYFGKPG